MDCIQPYSSQQKTSQSQMQSKPPAQPAAYQSQPANQLQAEKQAPPQAKLSSNKFLNKQDTNRSTVDPNIPAYQPPKESTQ